MSASSTPIWKNLPYDMAAGTTLFLVATPLLLGIAATSNAPLISGVLAGIVGGLLVGYLSGSNTSVTGPSAGLTAIVAMQIGTLGSFPAFLLAVVIAGLIQIGLGLANAGILAAFFPSSVIKGLLAAIGIILILKQIPHVLGHDTDPEGEMSFLQPDRENTFSEFGNLLTHVHPGAALIGLVSLAVLFGWSRGQFSKKFPLPAPLAVVLLGVGLNLLLRNWGSGWVIQSSHLVQMPLAESVADFRNFIQFPDWSQLRNPGVYRSAISIAGVASLETLLNLAAVDRLDPQQRTSPPRRELFAQGIGNITVGLLGGIPLTADVVRGAVGLESGSRTKAATIVHGALLFAGVLMFPRIVNLIPLSCLAAILLFTGVRLATPLLTKSMWTDGRYQFAPFIATVAAIVFTDLLVGVLIGLGVSLGFILNSNFRRPLRRTMERHLGSEVLHISLADQVSFLNRGKLLEVLDAVPQGGQVLLDAQSTDYIDPDVLELIRNFKTHTAPARGVQVSLIGFRSKYQLEDEIQYVDYSTRELQQLLTPAQVLRILKDGHERFRTGRRLTRDFGRQILITGAEGQHPMAVVLSCIDSRTPAELLFDLGVGDIFSVRVAGNTTSPKVLGSIEYGCAVAGAKLVLVMGHTRCGAVTTAVETACSPESIYDLTGCQHVEHVLKDIQDTIDRDRCARLDDMSPAEQENFINEVGRANVLRTVEAIRERSQTLARLADEGRIAIVGTIYDVATGEFTFWTNGLEAESVASSTNGDALVVG